MLTEQLLSQELSKGGCLELCQSDKLVVWNFLELVLRPQREQTENPKGYLEKTSVYTTSTEAWPNIQFHLVFPIRAFPSPSTFTQAVDIFTHPSHPWKQTGGKVSTGKKKSEVGAEVIQAT